MRTLSLVCCVLVGAAHAQAQEWTYARSEHFEVYTTGGVRRARDALTSFERVQAFFADVLKLAPLTATPIRLLVFSGDGEFAPYRPNGTAAAYYLPGHDRDYIVMRRFDADADPLVVHEYAHLIMRHSGARYPVWLSEGLADFFSTMQLEISRMAVGVVPPGRLAYLSDTAALMNLDRLFAVGHDSPEYNERAHVGLFYSQSWALTHMVLTHPRYHDRHGQFLDLMAVGTPAAVAFQEVYGRSVADVQRDLNAYVRGKQFGGFRAEFTPRALGPVPMRQVEPFEAELMLANLLANGTAGVVAARAAFDRLATQRDDDLTLIESRASLELRAGDSAQALPYLLRATALGSSSPWVYRTLAILQPNRAQEWLEAGVTRAPDDIETRLWCALHLVGIGRAGQALAVLTANRQVPQSWAFQYFQVMANAYLGLNDLNAGRNAARRAAAHASPGEQGDYAARLLAAIDAAALRQTVADRVDLPAGGAWTPAPLMSLPDGNGRPMLLTVVGRLRRLRCDGEWPILEVAAPGGMLRLKADDTDAFSRSRGADIASRVPCGSEDGDLIVRVRFRPELDLGAETVGRVRLIEDEHP